MPRAPYDRFIQSFSHVFAGGYAAGYYSYKWAEVLSADAFSLFEEQGVLSPAAGARFRDEVLARGGSRPALESFVAFRGRPPQLDALLRHNGMIDSHRRLEDAHGFAREPQDRHRPASRLHRRRARRVRASRRRSIATSTRAAASSIPTARRRRTSKNVQTKRLGANFVETSEPSIAAQQASERFPATLFTFECGEVCQNAEALLNKRGVPFTIVDVQTRRAGPDRMKALTGEDRAPVLALGDKIIVKGYSEARWQAALDEAGYPKTPAPAAHRRGRRHERAKSRRRRCPEGARAVTPSGQGRRLPEQ